MVMLAVDHQTLDLVEHGHVRGVGRVATEHPAGGHDVDGRLGVEHRADLHRRGVRAQQRGTDLPVRRDVIDEQRVELASGRVPHAHVERLEVVPVGLDLRAFGDLETEPDEHVLEPFPRLGDEVGVAPGGLADVLRQVEALGLDAGDERFGGECSATVVERRRDGAHGVVDRLAGGLLLVDRLESTELGLQLGEIALLAEQPSGERRRRRRVSSAPSMSASAASRAAVMSVSTWTFQER